MIVSPENLITQTVAKITFGEVSVSCSFWERNETYRSIMKSLNFKWSDAKRAWLRGVNQETGGLVIDRCAELAARLIDAGIPCDVNEDVIEKVKNASWLPEQKRWVKAIDGKFHLWWRGTNENLYSRTQMLPGSSYDHETKAVCVPSLYFQEVEGFALEHEFKFTNKAEELLQQARREYTRVILPQVEIPVIKKPKKREYFCDIGKFLDLKARNLKTKTELRSYQADAVNKLLPVRLGGLFMDMGTGKTRCAIELVAKRQERISKVIWFCPVTLADTIAAEIEKHTHGETVCILRDKVTSDNIPEAFWYIAGIESMSSSNRLVLVIDRLIDNDSFVIVDESTYIKGHASKRSMRIAEMGKRSKYRLLLTGTPITQGVEDLYAQMRFLSPDILGYNSFYSFAHNHLEYSDKYPGMIVRSLRTDRLAEKISPYIYQVTKEECLDLPDKLYDSIYFSLTDAQREAYEQAKYEILLGVDEPDSYVIFQLFTALQQIVSGFWNRDKEMMHFEHGRVNALKTAISGIPENEKIIIWCKFIESIDQIREAIPGCALYYGKLSIKGRGEQIEKFRNDARFLLATQATGGHGLTLNEAHYHIFYENEFKYSHRIQAEDRSHRIGQTMPVTYIDVISNSGIDKRIERALSKKQDVVKAFRQEINERKVAEL